MKTLRCLALVVCLAPLGLGAGVVQAAQQGSTATPPATEAAQAPPKTAGKPATQPAARPTSKAPAKARAASKSKSKAKSKKPVSKAVSQPVPQARLDLSLPKEMVRDLKPQIDNTPPVRTTLLPAMFGDSMGSDSGFQLNGRLISNEMQLQMRNDSRRDLEGAAIDFEFRQ